MFLRSSRLVLVCLGLICTVAPLQESYAGGVNGFRNSSVGGVSIDAEGVVGVPSDKGRKALLALMRKEVRDAGELTAPVPMRMISLRALNDACEEALRGDFGELPDEVRYLAGLQRIQYVFVYPDENDIVLAGPGEGWRLDESATVVGVTTGRPVLMLDDLLVALRTVHRARTEGISVSIEPTAAGYRRLSDVFQEQLKSGRRINPKEFSGRIREAFGPQQVKLSGVPATSHFARVLLAADYRMKRLAMKLDKSPVRKLPSYLDMVKGKSSAGVQPRWWMACNYNPMAASEDGLAWELRGPGVKVMTEDDFIAEDGTSKSTGKSSKLAQRWADLMTEHYEELSSKDLVFAELRNLMDMCVVAALIEKEGLAATAGLSIPTLTSGNSDMAVESWNAPKVIPPEVSFIRARGQMVFTASGGVQVESWQVASKKTMTPALAGVHSQAKPTERRLWWQ